MQRDFFCGIANVVHSTNPRHLVAGLHCLVYILFLRHLFDQSGKHFFGLLVDLRNMLIQLAAQQQAVIECAAVVVRIFPVPSAPDADAPAFRDSQAGQIIVALQLISEATALIINVFFHNKLLRNFIFAHTPQLPDCHTLLYRVTCFAFPCFCPYQRSWARVTLCETV